MRNLSIRPTNLENMDFWLSQIIYKVLCSWKLRKQILNTHFFLGRNILNLAWDISFKSIYCRVILMCCWPASWYIRVTWTNKVHYFLLTFWGRNYFFNLPHSVYKMWITQEPNKLDLWNKLHFKEKKKNGKYKPCLKYSVPIFVE